jgi:hypothetical protein
MTLLWVYLVMVGVSVAWHLRRETRASYTPLEATYAPSEAPPLSAADAAAVEGWQRELEARHYRGAGCFRQVIPRVDGWPPPKESYARVFLSDDERSIVVITHGVSRQDGADNQPTGVVTILNAVSRLADGRFVHTSNSPAPSPARRGPGQLGDRHPEIATVDALERAHAVHVARSGAEPSTVDDPIGAFAAKAEVDRAWLQACGVLGVERGQMVLTWWGKARVAANALDCLRSEARAPERSALYLLVIGAASVGATFALRHGGKTPDVPLATAVVVALSIAAHATFPRTAPIAVLVPWLGTRALWDIPDATPWPLVVSTLATPTIGPMVARRFSRAGALPNYAEPPWAARARLASLTLGVVAGAVLLSIVRLPKEDGPLVTALPWFLLVSAVSTTLVTFGVLVCSFVPSMRQSVFQHVCLAGTLTMSPVFMGHTAGMVLASEDTRSSNGRAAEISVALEEHRARRGDLPGTLDELRPAPFAIVPAPTAGLWPSHFDYERLSATEFRLSYLASDGRRVWVGRGARGMMVPERWAKGGP